MSSRGEGQWFHLRYAYFFNIVKPKGHVSDRCQQKGLGSLIDGNSPNYEFFLDLFTRLFLGFELEINPFLSLKLLDSSNCVYLGETLVRRTYLLPQLHHRNVGLNIVPNVLDYHLNGSAVWSVRRATLSWTLLSSFRAFKWLNYEFFFSGLWSKVLLIRKSSASLTSVLTVVNFKNLINLCIVKDYLLIVCDNDAIMMSFDQVS